MKYILAFVLIATFIARKILLRMLREQVGNNENLAELVTVKKKSRK